MTHTPEDTMTLVGALLAAHGAGDDAAGARVAALTPDRLKELDELPVRESLVTKLITVHGKHGTFLRHQRVRSGDESIKAAPPRTRSSPAALTPPSSGPAPRDSVVTRRPQRPDTNRAARVVSVAHRRRALHGLRNELELSAAIGGHNLPDSEPADVIHLTDATGKVLTDPGAIRANLRQRAEAVQALRTGTYATGAPLSDDARDAYAARLSLPAHFFEVKTLVTNKNSAVRMSRKAVARKVAWAEKYKAQFHLVALDDRRGSKNSGHRVYLVADGLAQTVRLDQMQTAPDLASVLTLVRGG